MTLSDGDKAICAEISREIIEDVSQKLLKIHLETCPYGKMLAKTKATFIGACIGSSVGGGSIVLAASKILNLFQ